MQFTATTAITQAPPPRTARAARLRAMAVDFGLAAATQAAFGAIALIVFLASTRGGERDLSTGAATIGWAVALAAVPAWLGLLGHSSAVEGGTPGQSAAGLTVEGGATRRLARLAVHPLSAPGWCWLAVVATLATVPGLPLLLGAVAVCVLGGGAISAVLLARDPNSPSLHDRLAGTRLVAR